MKRIIALISGIITITVILFWLGTDFRRTKSILFINANIVTMDEVAVTGNAVFVRDGLIKAIGPTNELEDRWGEGAIIVDLNGATLMPGFIDPHAHPALTAFFSNMIDLSGFSHPNNDAVWSSLHMAVQKANAGDWLICKGLDPVLTPDLITPSRTFLDSIAPSNPVFIISQSIHSYWANSMAFDEVGINRNTPNPSVSSYYEKDEFGELTGFIAEQEALVPFRNKITEIYGDQLIEQTISTLENYAANGNTSVVAMGLTAYEKRILDFYKFLSSANPGYFTLALSNLGILPKRFPTVRHFVYVRHDANSLLPDKVNNGDDFFKVLGVKFWYDGAPYTGSMYLEEPYLDTEFNLKKLHIGHNHRGAPLLSTEELAARILDYEADEWQIAVHSQGDRSTAEVIKAISSVTDTVDDRRHRIEHCLMIQKESLQEMAKLGIHPSFHINHLYYYGKALKEEIIGELRSEQMLPIRTADSLGLKFTMHADSPMFPSEPLSLVQTSISRLSKEGIQIGGKHAIDIYDALKALTIDAAWQIKMEDKIGSIKVGKYADFVILDRNPLLTPVEKIRDIKVLRTVVAGEDVYTSTSSKLK